MLVDECQSEDLLESRIDRESTKIYSTFEIKEVSKEDKSGAKSRDVISCGLIQAKRTIHHRASYAPPKAAIEAKLDPQLR